MANSGLDGAVSQEYAHISAEVTLVGEPRRAEDFSSYVFKGRTSDGQELAFYRQCLAFRIHDEIRTLTENPLVTVTYKKLPRVGVLTSEPIKVSAYSDVRAA